MKKIITQFTAILCTVLMIFTSNITAFAEESQFINDKNTVLPSGLTVREFSQKMEDITLSEVYYASAMMGIFQGDNVLYIGYFGYSDVENKIPVDENSVYEWGSISKTLIWVSAMQLWEQGKLDLERDIKEYLPNGFFKHLSYDEPITMMNLMNHNAGWQETTRPISIHQEKNVLSLGETLQNIEPAQINRPGEVVAYSNYGAALAGYVIECITKQDFCEYVHENIFEPLGMEHTALNPFHSDNEFVFEQRKNMKSYYFNIGNCINRGNMLDYIAIYPAGAVTGTISDLIIYGQALVNDDAPLFQSPETQKMMFTGTYFYDNSNIPTCTHGFWCNERAVRTYGHSGATNFGQANLEFDLDSKVGIAIMINEGNGNQFLNNVPTYVFGELSPNKYATNTTEEIELNGYYIPSRSTYCGMLKFIPYLQAISGKSLGKAERIYENLYQIRFKGLLDDNSETAIIIGLKNGSNGEYIIEQASVELVQDRLYILKLCLFTAYILLGIFSIFMFLIHYKYKKHGKYKTYKGQNIIIIGQFSWLVSVILVLISCTIYIQNSGGITYMVSTVIGILQIICIAISGISAIISIINLLKEKSNAYYYILYTLGNTIMIVTTLYFEVYRFWEI